MSIKSNHITSDGKSFSDLDQALAHQANLDQAKEFAGIAGAYVETVPFPKAESAKGLAAAKTMKRKDVTAVLVWLKANGVDLAPVATLGDAHLNKLAEQEAERAAAAKAQAEAQAQPEAEAA